MQEGILKVRHNVTEAASIDAFAKSRGGFDGVCKDVQFVRILGQYGGYAEEVAQMDRLLTGEEAEGRVKYRRMEQLPRLVSTEDVNYYSGCYDNWLAGGRKGLALKCSEQREAFKTALGAACQEVTGMFRRVTSGASASMEKNFAVKLMFWADQVGSGLLTEDRPGMDRKFVISNISRKQEYLFVCFLTLLGVDVLLLQYQSDLSEQALEGLGLSKTVKLGAFGPCTLPAFQSYVPKPEVLEHTKRRNNRTATPRERKPLEVRKAGTALRPVPPGPPPSPSGNRTNVLSVGNPGSGRTPGRELDFEELARLASSVVMISVHDRKGEILGNGSGIMIGAGGYILTNHHVATGGNFYSVRIEDDDKIYKTDEIIKYNSVLDLAVIRIDRVLKPLPIYGGARKLVRGQKVVAIGSPLGLFNSVSDGIISGFRVINDVDMIQFTAPISHGSSGGAVLNMYGEVIGISTAGFDNGQNINLAVGYEFIGQFVRGFTGQHGK